jgi:hypothetical protein
MRTLNPFSTVTHGSEMLKRRHFEFGMRIEERGAAKSELVKSAEDYL